MVTRVRPTAATLGVPSSQDADPNAEALLAAADALFVEVIRRIEEARPELRSAFLQVAGGRRRYCEAVDHHAHVYCDRPPNHQGEHSWEVARLRRRYAEYEELPNLVQKLRARIAELERAG